MGVLLSPGALKDIIIRGGTNISPRAVEDKLRSFKDILDIVVYGEPHPFWGEEIVVALVTKPNFNLNEFKAYSLTVLASDAVPSKYKIVNEFPRTNTGKVQINKLKETV